MIIFMLYFNERNTQIDNYTKSISSSFISAENSLNEVTYNIDNYFTNLYSNHLLKDDFYKFMQLNINEYVSQRLDSLTAQNIYGYSYLDSMEDLVKQNNSLIDYILYYNGSEYLLSDYTSVGQVRYLELSQEESELLMKGVYSYKKNLGNEDNFIGTVAFIINPEKQLTDNYKNSIGDSYLFRENEYTPLTASSSYTEEDYRYISSLMTNHGTLNLSNRGNIYYYISTSESFNYKVITIVEHSTLIDLGAKRLLTYCAYLLIIFLIITLFIMVKFSRESTFIEEIIDFINGAKKGAFSYIKVAARNDEFGLIANQLNDMSAQLQLHIKKEYILKIKQQQAEMKALITHINPHFLYNTLERIRMQALSSNNPFIAKATASLGQLYRNIVKTDTIIPLEKELAITEEYLELMSFLQEDDFLYHIDIDEGCLKLETVKIWMQPIIENFFKHNFTEEASMKIIIITGEENPEEYIFNLSSNLGYIEEENLLKLNSFFSPSEELHKSDSIEGGIGLLNIYSRLYYFYGSRVHMSINNNEPSGVTIKVSIKKTNEGGEEYV
ncbi:sensor histidine kinase [Alloiococcus sp. CFN-8]|uniref:sensor histidine kinase n=1 Tax=Alloiococcus sp. CFN-8 TaxID=3416081 RepID=UPI003CF6C73A